MFGTGIRWSHEMFGSGIRTGDTRCLTPELGGDTIRLIGIGWRLETEDACTGTRWGHVMSAAGFRWRHEMLAEL